MTGSIHDWFEPAITVRLVLDADFRALFRCKVCAALIEGSCRSWHRSWHLDEAATRVAIAP